MSIRADLRTLILVGILTLPVSAVGAAEILRRGDPTVLILSVATGAVLVGSILRYEINVSETSISKRTLFSTRRISVADVASYRVFNFSRPESMEECLYPPLRMELYDRNDRMLMMINLKLLRRSGEEDLLAALGRVVPGLRRIRGRS